MPGNGKQNYVVCISVTRDNGKTTRKEMSNLFFQNYHYYYGVKCFRNVDFEETDKVMDFEYCEEYLRSVRNNILLWQC